MFFHTILLVGAESIVRFHVLDLVYSKFPKCNVKSSYDDQPTILYSPLDTTH